MSWVLLLILIIYERNFFEGGVVCEGFISIKGGVAQKKSLGTPTVDIAGIWKIFSVHIQCLIQ